MASLSVQPQNSVDINGSRRWIVEFICTVKCAAEQKIKEEQTNKQTNKQTTSKPKSVKQSKIETVIFENRTVRCKVANQSTDYHTITQVDMCAREYVLLRQGKNLGCISLVPCVCVCVCVCLSVPKEGSLTSNPIPCRRGGR